MPTPTCYRCPSKKVESEFHFLFECQFYNDLRHGSVTEKAILGNQGMIIVIKMLLFFVKYK